MKTLYLECNMGAAGDMLTAALLETHPDPDGLVSRLNALGLPGVRFSRERMEKCGIAGTHMRVTVDGQEEQSADEPYERRHEHSHKSHEQEHHHEHHGLHDIEHIVSHLDVPEIVRADILAVYRLIAEAESHVHDCSVDQIHFHEVGTMDAVADVTAVCLLVNELAPEKIVASPVHVGSGQVHCAHGILPVPAPATAYLLRGIPTYGGQVQGELCTPTGAALLCHFVQEFGAQPMIKTERIGYGFGMKDFAQANCVRAMLGDTEMLSGSVIELCCNLDDMTPEEVGFAMERLFDAGALDVYTTPIGMKKNRPGVLLTCMCRAMQREEMIHLLFLHTTTLGLRETSSTRYALDRTVMTAKTPYGAVRIKRAEGFGVKREKAEYEDLTKIAIQNGLSLREVRQAVRDTEA